MFRKLHCIGFAFLLTTAGLQPAAAQFNTVPIGELTDSMRHRPKPALILISTDWCAYCRMQRALLKKSKTWQRIMSTVYFSELDAGMNQTVVFNEETYRFIPNGIATGRHELAFALGEIDNRLTFPTWVLLNEHFEIIFRFPGVIKANELSGLLETMHRRPCPE